MDSTTPSGQHPPPRQHHPQTAPPPLDSTTPLGSTTPEFVAKSVRDKFKGPFIRSESEREKDQRKAKEVMFLHLSVTVFGGGRGVIMSLLVMDSTTPSGQHPPSPDSTTPRQHHPPGQHHPAGQHHPDGQHHPSLREKQAIPIGMLSFEFAK